MIKHKIMQYALLSRQDRPIGTWLLLGSTSWGLVVAANGNHDWRIITVFVLGTWLMRSAGCIVNDYADRNLDGHVERTKKRPLATGSISEKEALALFFGFVSIAFVAVLFLRIEVLLLSCVALVLTVVYPFMKRFTWFPQVVLGLSFSLSIPMAFMAYQGRIPIPGFAMFVLSFLWIVAYDTIYAMLDSEDDEKIGIKSTALLFGVRAPLAVACLQFLFVLGWVQAGWFHQAKWGFWFALCGVILCFIYQGVLIRSADKVKIVQAFTNNQWVGWLIFVGVFFFP